LSVQCVRERGQPRALSGDIGTPPMSTRNVTTLFLVGRASCAEKNTGTNDGRNIMIWCADNLRHTTQNNRKETTMTEKKEAAEVATSSSPAELLRLAVQNNADVDKLEKLMALQERWEANQARKAFVLAMAAFQKQCPAIENTKEVNDRNGKLLYKHAPLCDIIPITGPIESELGFSHRFDTEPIDGGGAKVCCIVTHKEGHSERTTVNIPPTKGMNTNASQDHGIAITYGEKYSYRAAFGIVTGIEDVDGHTPEATITPAQVTELRKAIKASDRDEGAVLIFGGCDTLEAFPADKFQMAIETLTKPAKKKAATDQPELV